MSIVRWNLKEAAGKRLARRTETAYEATVSDEKAIIFKVLYLYGRHGRRCGGHKPEGGCALPGEVCREGWKPIGSRSCGTAGKPGGNREDKGRPTLVEGNPRREARLARQKSAEGIGGETNAEGPNMSLEDGSLSFDGEGEAG